MDVSEEEATQEVFCSQVWLCDYTWPWDVPRHPSLLFSSCWLECGCDCRAPAVILDHEAKALLSGMVGQEKEPGILVLPMGVPPAWPVYTGLLFKERGINCHPI